MEKEKKVINVLAVLFIFHKSNVKTFLNWILNQCRAAPVNMTHKLNNCAPLFRGRYQYLVSKNN